MWAKAGSGAIRILLVLGEGVTDGGSLKGMTGCSHFADEGFWSLSLLTSAHLWPGVGVGGWMASVGWTTWGSPLVTGEVEAV